jgi:hypothetical protein
MKTHLEAIRDGSIDKMSMKEINKLVGFYEPEDKGKRWFVSLADGGIYETKTQFEAEVISSLEQIKALLIKEK